MTRALGVGALVLVSVLATSSANAKPTVDKKNYLEIELGSDWTMTSEPAPDGKTVTTTVALATISHASGDAAATLIRINHPNRPAWRKKKHYFDEVARGLAAATPGYRLGSKRQTKIGRVPVLDIRYRRTHESRPHVAVRFVFFRTFTLIVSVPSTRAKRGAASALARSLKPHL